MSRTAPQSTIPPWRHRWRHGARIAFVLLAAAIAGQAAAADWTAHFLGKWPDQLRGELYSVAVDQGFAYVGLHGPGFLILDVRNPAAPEFVSDLDLGGWTAGLAISGTTVYLSNGELGLQVIDVADRARPQLVATLQTAPANRPFENFPHAGSNVAVSGHHVYLADGNQGFKVFDVSDPTQPKLLGRLNVPNTEGVEAVAVSISGDRAYLACGYGGLWVVDISNPAAPRRITTVPPSEQGLPVVHVAVSGNVAYFTDRRNLVALDVSDPGNPRRTARSPIVLPNGMEACGPHWVRA